MSKLPSFPEIVALYKELRIREKAWYEPLKRGFFDVPPCDLLESALNKAPNKFEFMETLFGAQSD